MLVVDPAVTRVAFLGLGTMGFAMAGHVLKWYRLNAFNRNPLIAERFAHEYQSGDGSVGGRLTLCDSPREAVRHSDVVLTCLGNDDDVRRVYTDQSKGLISALKKGAVVIDHTTTSAALAREMFAAVRAAGGTLLDAPVSGGQSGAQSGRLAIMCGGDSEVFEAVRPLLTCYGSDIVRVGDSGSGQLAKMVNQICIAGLLQGLSEALVFGQRAGLDMSEVLPVIGSGAAQSWQMNHRGQTMLEDRFDFGFKIKWMVKDLGYCLDQADSMGVPLDITRLVRGYYETLMSQGDGDLDTSALIRRLRTISSGDSL